MTHVTLLLRLLLLCTVPLTSWGLVGAVPSVSLAAGATAVEIAAAVASVKGQTRVGHISIKGTAITTAQAEEMLSTVTAVDDGVTLASNPQLGSVSGALASLQTVGGDFSLNEQRNWKELELPSLATVGGTLTLKALTWG